MKLALAAYRFLLRLYPRAFRERFAGEMETVFAAALDAAAAQGQDTVLRVLATEALDQPISLARQHWLALFQAGGKTAGVAANLAGGTVALGGPPRATRSDLWLAGLPYFLAALAGSVQMLLIAVLGEEQALSADEIITLATSAVLILAFAGSLIFYLLQRRKGRHPLWAASWTPFWTVGFFAIAMTALNSKWFPGLDFIGYVILPLGIAYGLYRAARADRLGGLLASLLAMFVLWMITNEMVPVGPRGLVWLATYTLGGLCAALIVRWQNLHRGMALALGAIALAGFANARNGIYLGGMLPFSEPGPSLSAVLDVYIPMLTLAAALMLGPQLARTLRDLGLSGAAFGGKWAYRLSLTGVLLAIVAVLLHINSVINDTGLWRHYPALRPLIDWVVRMGLYPETTILVIAGLVVYTLGFALTLLAAFRAGELDDWLAAPLLFLALPGVPMILSNVDPMIGYFAGDVNRLPGHLVGLVWLALAVYTLLRWTRAARPRPA